MKRRPHNSKKADPALAPRRRLFFILLAFVLTPLLAFGLLEGALRMAGYGYDTAFFKRERIDGRDFFVNNDNFVLRFFPPELARLPGALRMEAQKPPNTCRIFILGGSAALGDPSPPYAAGRYLQTLLSERFPDKKFEVANVSITAINSHVILPIARECAQHDGDFWIVYMGNNEMVGPFGAASVFGTQAPPLWLVRVNLALQKTRVGQWLTAGARGLKFKSGKSDTWAGMGMFLGHQVAPDDPRKERVYQNFQENLHDILQTGLDSGARVLLNTVAVNLKDCSPFASVSSPPFSADLQYKQAEDLFRTTNFAEAREHFQKACDDDALPFRADSRINGVIRDAARQSANSNLIFFDAAARLAGNNPAGVCGDETFLEHVHFNFDGNYRLAMEWAGTIGPLLGMGTGEWLSQGDCENRLGLTDWNRAMTATEVIHRRRQPPLNSQMNNEEELAALTNEITALRQRMDAAAGARARSLYADDIRRNPEDWLLLFNFADFLEATGDWKSAAAVWKKGQALLPEYYLCYFQEGRMLERLGRLDEAEADFRRTVSLHPRMAAAWIELSNIHASEQKLAPALEECARAQSLEPDQPAFDTCMGKVLSRMNRASDAMEQYRNAIAIRPDYIPARLELGRLLAQQGSREGARQQFEEVLRLDAHNHSARQQLDSLAK